MIIVIMRHIHLHSNCASCVLFTCFCIQTFGGSVPHVWVHASFCHCVETLFSRAPMFLCVSVYNENHYKYTFSHHHHNNNSPTSLGGAHKRLIRQLSQITTSLLLPNTLTLPSLPLLFRPFMRLSVGSPPSSPKNHLSKTTSFTLPLSSLPPPLHNPPSQPPQLPSQQPCTTRPAQPAFTTSLRQSPFVNLPSTTSIDNLPRQAPCSPPPPWRFPFWFGKSLGPLTVGFVCARCFASDLSQCQSSKSWSVAGAQVQNCGGWMWDDMRVNRVSMFYTRATCYYNYNYNVRIRFRKISRFEWPNNVQMCKS